MKKLLFVYNPHAGKGVLKAKLSDIIDIFVKAGYEVTVYPTQAFRDAYRKVKELTDEYDLVVCSGGDGTIDEVVSGMMRRKTRIPIGYIPTGTTNDFANSLMIPKNLLEAAYDSVNGVAFPCDMGQFNDGIFVYIAAFGLFTDVPYQTDQKIKNVLGHLAYLLEGTKRLLSVPSYKIKVTHDEETIEDEFVYGMVTNSRSVAGFRNMVGNHVQFDDGVFEVTLIKTPKNPIELTEIIEALLIEQVNSKYMYTFKTSKVVFESEDEIPWTLDGEYGGDHNEVAVKNLNKAIEIMVKERHLPQLSVDGHMEEEES